MIGLPIIAALGRWWLFAALALAIGAASFRFFVLAPLLKQGGSFPEDDSSRGYSKSAQRYALCLWWAAAVALLPAVLLRLITQAIEFRDPFEPMVSELRLLIFGTSWGRTWLLQAALSVLLVLLLWVHQRWRSEFGWILGGLLTAALALTPALSGHAMSSDPVVVGVLADWLHVIGAGLWLGTLAVLIVSLRSADTAEERGRMCVSLLSRYSPLARFAVFLLVVTGTVGAWLHFDVFSSLWTSDYGRFLSLKVCIVLLAFILGWRNWKRLTPELQRNPHATGRMIRSAGLELGLGLLVLLVTAFFVVTPPPTH